MTTMTNGIAGGSQRKSLAHQIDRLDGMLDGLSEALNEAIAEALKGAMVVAVREAVQVVLREILSNPELLAKLHRTTTPTPAPAQPVAKRSVGLLSSVWLSVRTLLREIGKGCKFGLGLMRRGTWTLVKRGCARVRTVWHSRYLLNQYRRQLLAALGVGLTLGMLAWYSGPWLASLASMAGGFTTTLALQAGMWLRRVTAPMRRQEV
jgi:hypothetical protein